MFESEFMRLALAAGAIVGGLFLQFFPDLVAGLGKGLSGLLYAVLLIAAMVLMPTGIVGAFKKVIPLPRLTGEAGRGKAAPRI